MPHPAAVKRLIDDFVNRRPMRTTSLIVTFFGDVVSQHGNTVWLGSLVHAMAPLGINERLVCCTTPLFPTNFYHRFGPAPRR